MKARKKTVSDEILREIVRRIVAAVQPEKIILFGSAARGKMGPNSDVDLLVIKKGKYHRCRVTGKIYRNMFGVGQAVDVIVVTPEEVEKYRDTHCLVIKPALQEGREIYHA
jgi:predicted nucleotidyltransferase